MDTLVALQVREAPEHPVLPNAKTFDIRQLRFEWTGYGIAALELELSNHTEYVILRFEGVEDLNIESGEVPSAILVQIQDTSMCTSGRGLLPPVRVGGAGVGNLSFWARTVKRV